MIAMMFLNMQRTTDIHCRSDVYKSFHKLHTIKIISLYCVNIKIRLIFLQNNKVLKKKMVFYFRTVKISFILNIQVLFSFIMTSQIITFIYQLLYFQPMTFYTATSILLLLCLLPITKCFWDYNENHTLSCLDVDSTLTFTQQSQDLWKITILHQLDTYLFLICQPFLFLIQLALIINYLKNRVLLVRPGDIFFVILISDTIGTLYYLSSAIFYMSNSTSSDMPASFVPYCIINSVIITFVYCMQACCLFMFFFYIIYTLKSNALKQSSFWFKYPPYIAIIIVSIIVCNLLWFYDFLGLNNQGLCGITMTRRGDFSTLSIPICQFIMDIIFLVFGLYTWFFFKKHMPKTEGLKRRSYQINVAIGIYLIGFTIINFVFTIYDVLTFCNCYLPDPIPSFTILATLDNITKIIKSIFIIFLILLNRRFRRKILKMLRGLFQKKTRIEKSKSIQLQQFFTNELDFGMDDRIIELIEQENRIDLFKIAQIITIVSGVKISQKQYMKELTSNSLKKIYYCQTITFKIGPRILNDYDAQSQFLPRVGMLDGTITLHCPRVFKRLLANDNLLNVQKSFDLLKNYQKMYNLVEGQGGKSGEFFFFTYDNKYVLKTITKFQFEFLLNNIEAFARHFDENPFSLLAKIYGLYTITSDQVDKKVHLILMKNLIGRPKQRILRTYDIKGSKYDRQVIKPQKHYKFNEIRKLTLKDTDFMKLEGKLYIDPSLIKPLRQIVKNDTLFLKSLNLIDYSLLIVKLYDPAQNGMEQQDNKRVTNDTDCLQNKELLNNLLQMIQETIKQNQSQNHSHLHESSIQKIQDSSNKIFHKYQRMHSIDAPFEFYHIGIIDYMQKWDLQKKGEKWWKTITGKKDVSAQQPNIYQKRFLNFVEQITMTDNVSIFSEEGNFELQNQLSLPKQPQQISNKSLKQPLIFQNQNNQQSEKENNEL